MSDTPRPSETLADTCVTITGGTGSFGSSDGPATPRRRRPTRCSIFSRDEQKQDEMRRASRRPAGPVLHRRRARLRQRRPGDAGRRLSCSTPRRSSRCRPASSSRWRRCGPTSSAAHNVIEAQPWPTVSEQWSASAPTRRSIRQRDGHVQGDDGEDRAGRRPQQPAAADHGIDGDRYGNVMCSRGSVIPLFVEQLRAGSRSRSPTRR